MQVETFKDQILAKLQSNPTPLNKKVIILLESIEDQQKQATNENAHKTQLFVSLVSLIKLNVELGKYENMDAQTLLLNWLFPIVSGGVILKLSQTLGQLIRSTLNDNSDNPIVGKYCVAILGQLLAIQQSSDLNEQHCQLWFRDLLTQVTNEKKVIRKQACKMIKKQIEEKPLEIFSNKNNHFKESLQSFFSTNLVEMNEKCSQAIALLVQIHKNIPYTLLGDTLQFMISQLSVCDRELLPHFLLGFETILVDRQMSSDTIERILTQILQLQLEVEDTNQCLAYIQCLRQCIISLVAVSKQNGANYLPSVISMMIEYLVQENTKLQKQASIETIKVIQAAGTQVLESQQNDVDQEIMLLELDTIMQVGNRGNGSLIQKYIITMQYLLSNRFDGVQNLVLNIIGAFFQTIKTSTFPHIREFVLTFVEQRERLPKNSFDNCFGKLINAVDLSVLVELFPIKITIHDAMDSNFENSSNVWLISIASQHVHQVSLCQYYIHLMPILLQALSIYDQLSPQQERIYLSIIQQLFEILSKCKILETDSQQKYQKIHQDVFSQSILLSQSEKFLIIIKELINNKYPFYNSMLHGAEKVITQLAFNKVTEKLVKDKAQSFISKLATLVISGDERSRPTLNMIRVLAYSTPQTYLIKAIGSNMQRILENSTSKETDKVAKGLKDMEILLQVIPAVKFQNDTWSQCINFATRLLQEKTRFQKKAYKFIVEIINKVHYTFLEEVSILLIESTSFVQSFSRSKRLQVLQLLMEKQFGVDESGQESRYTIYEFQTFIQNFLPEIVVSVRDSNLKVRLVVRVLLSIIGKKLLEINQLEQFISMVVAGLASSQSLMKADALATISELVELFYNDLSKEFLLELTQIILLMVKEKNNEIYKAVIGYFKSLFRQVKANKIDAIHIKTIMQELFEGDNDAKEKNIIIVKRLIIRFIKAFGYEIIEKAFPESHIKLLRNIKRVDKRTKKNKIKKDKKQASYRKDIEMMVQKIEKKNQRKNKRKQRKEDDYDDSDQEKPKVGRGNQMEEEVVKDDDKNNLLLKYDYNKEKFHFSEDTQRIKQSQSTKFDQNQTKQFMDVEYIGGKVVVKMQEEKVGLKRRRENRYEAEEEKKKETKQEPSIVKKSRQVKQGKEQTIHIIHESGEQYRPKHNKTGGDLMIKGRPEPFAFIQLNPKVLNKRFRAKAQKSFDQVLNKKSGAFKGMKITSKE